MQIYFVHRREERRWLFLIGNAAAPVMMAFRRNAPWEFDVAAIAIGLLIGLVWAFSVNAHSNKEPRDEPLDILPGSFRDSRRLSTTFLYFVLWPAIVMVDVGFLGDLQGYYFWIVGLLAPLFAMFVVYVCWKLNERDMSARGFRWW